MDASDSYTSLGLWYEFPWRNHCLCGVSFQDIENDVFSVLDGHFVIVYIKSWKQVTGIFCVPACVHTCFLINVFGI